MKIEAKKNKYNVVGKVQKQQGKATADIAPIEPEPTFEQTSPLKPKKVKSKLPTIKKPKIKIPSIKIPSITMPDLKVPQLKVPHIQLKGKPIKYVIIPLLSALVAVFIVWLGMNLRKHPVPKPLFTKNNLQSAPAADTNGYLLIYDNQVFNEFAYKDISDVNLFRNASTIEIFLDKTRGEYTFARTLAARDDVKKLMDIFRDIIKKPVFEDIVIPVPNDSQKYRTYISLHNAVTAMIITRMQDKKYSAAFSLMKDQLNINIQYLKTARSMANYIAAIQLYEKSMNIFKSMLNEYNTNAKGKKDALGRCREIAEVIGSFNPNEVPIAPIVMFEYIMHRKLNLDQSIQHPEAPIIQGMKNKSLSFFDRGLTQQIYDDRWKKIYECALNPSEKKMLEVKKIQEERLTEKRLWWLHNAVGKKLLDNIPLTIYSIFTESKNWTTVINQKQSEIITIVNSLKEEAKPEKKGDNKPDKGKSKPTPKKQKKKKSAAN